MPQRLSCTPSRRLSRHLRRLVLVACCTALLPGCGGGGDSATSSTSSTVNAGPSSLQTTDTVVGTGTVAAVGSTVTVNYTAWLYSASAVDFKGTQIDSSATQGASLTFVVGAGQLITGFEQGVVGMRVGGTRTLLIPSSLAYGASGSGVVPANTGLVFAVQLLAVQ